MISYDDVKSGKAAMPVAVAAVAKEIGALPAMVKAAAAKLASATTAAEVLDAKDAAALVYDASKRAARMAKAKKAHDDLIAAAHRAQADALDIEAAAKRRLADEYDGGQERGEIVASGDTLKRGPGVPQENAGKATAAEVGITRKEVHEARRVRNAEQAQPGVVREALDKALHEGKEPSRALVNTAVAKALGETKPIDARSDEDRELYNLQNAWDAAREIVRGRFLKGNSLGMASEGMDHSAEGANAGEGHVDRSALRASSAVQFGATNSPDGAEFQAKINEDACAVGQDARAEEKSKAPGGAELVSRGVGDRAPTTTTENGRDSVERHATNSQIVPTSPRQVDVSSPRINSSLAARDDDASAAINSNSAPSTPKVTEQAGVTAAPPVTPAAPPKEPKLNPDCQKAARGEACFLSHSAASCSKCASAATKARKTA